MLKDSVEAFVQVDLFTRAYSVEDRAAGAGEKFEAVAGKRHGNRQEREIAGEERPAERKLGTSPAFKPSQL